MNEPPSGLSTAEQAAADAIAHADLQRARAAITGVAVRTPTIACEDLAELSGTEVALKAECLQGTGSFKLRGALSKVAALGERASAGLAIERPASRA